MKTFSRRLALALWLLLCLATPSYSAISAAVVWETRASGASDNNGGGAVAGIAGETDRSQQNAAQVAIDHVAITSSTTTSVITFTGGTYTVLAGDIGNIVQVISGTNTTPGFFQITAVSAGLNGTWTMDRNVVSAGTQTDLVANMGGALATLGKLAGAMVASNKAYCTGAFTVSAGTTWAQAVTPSGGTPATRIIGYGVTRGDAVHATVTITSGTGITVINNTGSGLLVEQLDVDCGSFGTSTGYSFGNFSGMRSCKVANFTTTGMVTAAARVTVTDCEFTGGTSAATAAVNATGSVKFLRDFIHDNACTGVILAAGGNIKFSLICNNSGASSDGVRPDFDTSVMNNTIHNNGRHGINNLGTLMIAMLWRNNLITSNGGFGIVGNSSTAMPADPSYDGNAFFSNTSGTRSNMDSTAGIYGVSPYTNTRDVILSASPYVGPTTGSTANFGLNSTAGGGVACKGKGSPGTWPGNTGSLGSLDMGAVQSAGAKKRIEIIH